MQGAGKISDNALPGVSVSLRSGFGGDTVVVEPTEKGEEDGGTACTGEDEVSRRPPPQIHKPPATRDLMNERIRVKEGIICSLMDMMMYAPAVDEAAAIDITRTVSPHMPPQMTQRMPPHIHQLATTGDYNYNATVQTKNKNTMSSTLSDPGSFWTPRCRRFRGPGLSADHPGAE